MADVIRIPSIWDYLGQGIGNASNSWQEIRKRNEDKQMQELGLATQLFGQGAIDSGDYNAMSGKVFPNMPVVKPSQGERARTILSSDINPATGKPWTFAERQNAGLPSASAEVIDQAQGVKAQGEISAAAVRDKYLKGEPISAREGAVLGLPDDETLQAGRLAAQDKVLSEVGPKYMDTVLAPVMSQNGGRIPTNNWKALADQAYAAYETDRKTQGMAPNPAARAYFASQLLDRLTKQRQLDIDQQNANSNASLRRNSQEDRTFQMLSTVVETRRKVMDDLMSGDKSLAGKIQLAAKDPNSPFNKDPNVIRYKAAESAMHKAQNAQARLATNSPEMQSLLDMGSDAPAGPSGIRQDVVTTLTGRVKNANDLAQLAKGVGTIISQEEFDAVKKALMEKSNAR